MSTLLNKVPIPVQGLVLHMLYALPEPLRRLVAGPPVHLDGNELALDAQLFLRLVNLSDIHLSDGTETQARQRMEESCPIAAGPLVEPVRLRDLDIPSDAGPIPARLYTPSGLEEGSPLLVYYHGGGFVLGSVDSHDNLCRFLAKHAELRVLSIDYRLAPEHPFPAAPTDALAAFEYAARNAAELGVDASAIAVGGDSAGANLAAVTSYQALRAGGPQPAFQLLFYPGMDLANRYPSEDLFADGFFLTGEDLEWFHDRYCPEVARRADPLVSPLLADDARGLPPTYLATAGFDPLRDSGAAYAKRLREAGVPVVYRCQRDLIHGYVNFIGLGRRFREAVAEAAGALRTGLAFRSARHADDLFGKRPNSRSRKEQKMR